MDAVSAPCRRVRVMVRESRDTCASPDSGVPFTNRLVSKFDLPVVGWREVSRATRPSSQSLSSRAHVRRPRMRLALPLPVTLASLVPSPDKPGERWQGRIPMLEELDIRNLGPIREATIAPAAGMTAIRDRCRQNPCCSPRSDWFPAGPPNPRARLGRGGRCAWAWHDMLPMMPSHLNIPATPTMPVLAMPTVGSHRCCRGRG